MAKESTVIIEKKKVGFCFDGSVSTQLKYDKPEDISGKAVSGVQNLFQRLYVLGFEITVYSSRCRSLEGFKAVTHWLCEHCLIEYVSSVIPYAPDCGVIVDSRSVGGHDVPSLVKAIGSKEKKYEEE